MKLVAALSIADSLRGLEAETLSDMKVSGVWPATGTSYDGQLSKEEVQVWRNKRLLISNYPLM